MLIKYFSIIFYPFVCLCDITADSAAPKNFRDINSTCTAITFQWDPIFQNSDVVSWHVITCSSLKDDTVVTVSIVPLFGNN